MLNQDLKDEYLRELGELLGVYVQQCINDYGGLHEWVNDQIVSGGFAANASDADFLDPAIWAWEKLNKMIPNNLGIQFWSILLDNDMSLISRFHLTPDDEFFIELSVKQSDFSTWIGKGYEKDFDDAVTDQHLHQWLATVKEQATFGLLRSV